MAASLSHFEERVDEFVRHVARQYNRYSDKVESVIFLILMFSVSYVFLRVIPFFPYRWVVLISALLAALSIKSRKTSFTIFWLLQSISLFYQNSVAGILSLIALPFVAGVFASLDEFKQILCLASVVLLFVNFEFFPIVLAAIIYGAGDGVKASLTAFFTAFILCVLLPVNSIGHVTLDFNVALLANPKPPAPELTLSALTQNANNWIEFSRFFGNLINGVLHSSLIIGLFLGYVLIGIIPSYVKDALKRKGRIPTLLGLLIASYLPLLAVNYVYGGLPSFELTPKNVVTLVVAIVLAWLIAEIITAPTEEADRPSPPSPPRPRPESRTFVATSRPEPRTQQPRAEPEQVSRVEALKRELDRRDKK